MMDATLTAFYAIAAFILATGILTVTARGLFRSAIWLLFSLIGIAALYFLLQVEFAAAVQVIVYVGGIVVLIIFSIFLTNQGGADMPKALDHRKVFGALAALAGAGMTCSLLVAHAWTPSSDSFDSGVNRIGHMLVGTGKGSLVLPFELVSVLLLAAMIGCIVIAMKSRHEEK
jgi:NADH-quinone oxidoreductase subunit J